MIETNIPTNYRELKALIKRISGQANFIGTPRIYVDIFEGDLVAAVWFNQVVYWDDKTSEPIGFYKTAPEWTRELGLSPFQVRRVSRLCEKLGIVNITNRKVYGTPKLHYLVIWPELLNLLNRTINKLESQESEYSETRETEGKETEDSLENQETEDSLTEIEIPTENEDIELINKLSPVWEKVKESIKGDTLRLAFENYVKDTRAINFADGILEVEAPTEAAREWLADRATKTAENLLIGILNQEVSVSFITGGAHG